MEAIDPYGIEGFVHVQEHLLSPELLVMERGVPTAGTCFCRQW
jgi:hypothetical protein